jgi:hypothetical protein
MDDEMAIWFVQRVGREIRLIDYYANSGEGLAHYAKVLKRAPYNYSRHIGPHDIEVRELGTGKSRKETAEEMGLRPFEVAPKLEVQDGIEAVRNLLPRCWFDAEKCADGIRALKNYRKDWDENRGVWLPRPRHDWASHRPTPSEPARSDHGQDKALAYAKGEMTDLPSLTNRSAATDSTVADAVETVLPDVLEVFIGGEDVATFQPQGEEDEERAQEETDYVNHVVFAENEGFLNLYTAFKDALLTAPASSAGIRGGRDPGDRSPRFRPSRPKACRQCQGRRSGA